MIELYDAFSRDMMAQPLWVQLWVNFMGLVLMASILFVFVRAEARWTLLAMVCVVPSLFWLYSRFGYQRILGLPHLVFWTPLVIYLWRRRDLWRVRETWSGKWIVLAFTVMCISLVIDLVDVIRYAAGERI